jgi:hypothetical protein
VAGKKGVFWELTRGEVFMQFLRLREDIRKKGMTYEEVGERLGIPPESKTNHHENRCLKMANTMVCLGLLKRENRLLVPGEYFEAGADFAERSASECAYRKRRKEKYDGD